MILKKELVRYNLKVYKPQGVVSKLKFISETLDITEYTGYMKGTIDFGNFWHSCKYPWLIFVV